MKSLRDYESINSGNALYFIVGEIGGFIQEKCIVDKI